MMTKLETLIADRVEARQKMEPRREFTLSETEAMHQQEMQIECTKWIEKQRPKASQYPLLRLLDDLPDVAIALMKRSLELDEREAVQKRFERELIEYSNLGYTFETAKYTAEAWNDVRSFNAMNVDFSIRFDPIGVRIPLPAGQTEPFHPQEAGKYMADIVDRAIDTQLAPMIKERMREKSYELAYNLSRPYA